MITTNNQELDARFRLLRQHGMSISDAARHSAREVVFEEYLTTGFNYRMTDIQAAVGIEQLKRLDGFIRERRSLALAYADLLKSAPCLQAPSDSSATRSNWQSYAVRLQDDAPWGQRELMQKLLDCGVSTRRGIMNSHQEVPYQEMKWALPESEKCRDNVILFPLYNGMNRESLELVSTSLYEAIS